MAASGYTPISLYYSSTAAATPTAGNLVNGELAINITDGKLYYKDNAGTVKVIAGTGGTGVVAGSNTQVQYNNNGVFGASSNFTFDGTTVTANALTVSNAVTLSGGTANGVAYLNGSKVLTTGSALTFDGTTLTSPIFANSRGVIQADNPIGTGFNIAGNTTTYFGTTTNTPIVFIQNYSEQMRLTSTGLGIGTSSPAYKLDVKGTPNIAPLALFENTLSREASIEFKSAHSSASDYRIGASINIANAFEIVSSSTSTTRLAIDSSGNLGLGVTPSAWYSGAKVFQMGLAGALYANTAVNQTKLLNNAYYNSSGNPIYLNNGYAQDFTVGTSGQYIWYQAPSGTAGSAITFTQAMTLDASGNLGVGTTAIYSRLRVQHTDGAPDASGNMTKGSVFSYADGGLAIALGNSSVGGYSWINSAYANNSGVSAPLAFFTGATERMRIDSSGNVGIGTSSPSYKLDVTGTTTTGNSTSLRVYRLTAGVGDQNAILWGAGGISTASISDLVESATAGSLVFKTTTSSALTERMRLDSSGNLGLGVTLSAWAGYKVFELPYGVSLFAGTADAQCHLTSNTYINTSYQWIYKSNDYASRYQQQTGKHMWFTAPSGTAGNAISFTQAMTLDASGNLGIGTSVPNTNSFWSKAITLNGAAGTNAAYELRYNGNLTAYLSYSTSDSAANLWNYANAPLTFGTNNTERMRIDSSGNVGIGTSSPSAKLTVVGSGVMTSFSDSSSADLNISLSAGVSLITPTTGTLAFGTASTERMRIDSSGNLLVGTTSNINNSKVAIAFDGASNNCLTLRNTASSGTPAMLTFQWGTTNVGSIVSTSTATSYNTSSDYRLKENVRPMQNALGVVAQLNPVTYTWKADGSDGQGFIAHELQAVVPDCVTGEKDAVDAEGNPVYQGMDTSFLVATLTKAIQELKAELDATKAEVATLKGA